MNDTRPRDRRARTDAARRLPSRRALGLLVVALTAGCAAEERAPSVYVHPNADMSAFHRIAVLPLDNLTSERFAGERVREVLVAELLAQGFFELVDVGEVNRVLRVRNIARVTELGPEAIAALGEDLQVDALLLGSVMEYGARRTGSFTAPEIALALRLVEIESGTIIWSVSDARTGMDVWTRLFGVGEESQTESVRELVRQLMDDLFAVAGT